jgi:hypothetical protein
MPLDDQDITVVFQGPVLPGPAGTAECLRRTRQVLPRSRYVLSTWNDSPVSGLDVDHVVVSEDPGGLPGIKRRDGAAASNNVNRQILSTRQGLRETKTRYAIKLRTDCALEHAGFLRLYERVYQGSGRPRIIASSLFTIDPSMFEQLPYHVSDWFQFGESAALRTYWSGPFMSARDAVYYETHPQAPHATFMDRRFRSRLAVEQFMVVHYASGCGYPVPAYHNDIRQEVLDGYRRCLAEQFLILDPWDIGLRFTKYEWAYHSSFQRLNCLLFSDWYQLYLEYGGTPIGAHDPAVIRRRQRQKQIARRLGKWFDKAGPLLLRPGLKPLVNQLLTILAWQAGGTRSLSGSHPTAVLSDPSPNHSLSRH